MGVRLGRYIKEERRNKKISAAMLSKKTGISKSYIDYIESGAREPQAEMLIKISVAMQIPLETLVDIQKNEQVDTAIAKMRAENAESVEGEVRDSQRGGNRGVPIDDKALAKVQASFKSATGDRELAEYVENQDLKAIVRAGAILDDEDLKKIKGVMESLYPDAFNGE